MKKLISAVLICVMLAALAVVPASAEQTNVDVNALQFTKAPTIDGVISEEEWGAYTVSVKGSEAATEGDEAPNEFNTYAEFQDEEILNAFSFEMWLRWDADYFYLAAVLHDPDGHSNTKKGNQIWDGDCIQFRPDPAGPNSAIKKADPNYDYKTTAYDWVKYNFKGGNNNKIFANETNLLDVGVGLSDGTDPVLHQMEPEDYDLVEKGGLVGITTVDLGDGVDTFNCDTTYEVAIPWSEIGMTPVADYVMGLTVVAFNTNASSWSAFITWGSGICGGQAENKSRKTIGGVNAVTLSAETVTPADEYAIATTEPVTEAPETTEAPDTTKATESTAATTTAPKGPTNFDDVKGEFPTWAIILIIVAAVVVVAVVVIVVVKKKKK